VLAKCPSNKNYPFRRDRGNRALLARISIRNLEIDLASRRCNRGDLPRRSRRRRRRRWRAFYFFSRQEREAKFEIHYLIKLKEMSAESNVMEGLKGSVLGERNDNTTSRWNGSAWRVGKHSRWCVYTYTRNVYTRIGTIANLNADRGLNAVDVRTHESTGRGTLPWNYRIVSLPPLPLSLSLSLSFSPSSSVSVLLALFARRFPALMPPLGF